MAECIAQVVESLPSMLKALGLILTTSKQTNKHKKTQNANNNICINKYSIIQCILSLSNSV
jgi:hypothetical protein